MLLVWITDPSPSSALPGDTQLSGSLAAPPPSADGFTPLHLSMTLPLPLALAVPPSSILYPLAMGAGGPALCPGCPGARRAIWRATCGDADTPAFPVPRPFPCDLLAPRGPELRAEAAAGPQAGGQRGLWTWHPWKACVLGLCPGVWSGAGAWGSGARGWEAPGERVRVSTHRDERVGRGLRNPPVPPPSLQPGALRPRPCPEEGALTPCAAGVPCGCVPPGGRQVPGPRAPGRPLSEPGKRSALLWAPSRPLLNVCLCPFLWQRPGHMFRRAGCNFPLGGLSPSFLAHPRPHCPHQELGSRGPRPGQGCPVPDWPCLVLPPGSPHPPGPLPPICLSLWPPHSPGLWRSLPAPLATA